MLIEPTVHGDERGFFTETYRREWHEALGIPEPEQFVQDNHSRSARGVLRGMHFRSVRVSASSCAARAAGFSTWR